jgi:hypothetical protein
LLTSLSNSALSPGKWPTIASPTLKLSAETVPQCGPYEHESRAGSQHASDGWTKESATDSPIVNDLSLTTRLGPLRPLLVVHRRAISCALSARTQVSPPPSTSMVEPRGNTISAGRPDQRRSESRAFHSHGAGSDAQRNYRYHQGRRTNPPNRPSPPIDEKAEVPFPSCLPQRLCSLVRRDSTHQSAPPPTPEE